MEQNKEQLSKQPEQRDSAERLQLTGGNTIRKDRRELDFYPTPWECTHALMEFLLQECQIIISKVWEPACGDLAMSKVIESFGIEVVSTDIKTGQDYLITEAPLNIDAIITNPPFALSEAFINKALSESRIVCMLLKSQYWHAKKRQQIFTTNPPSYVLPLTWRPDFLNGEKGGAPTMEVQWSVWLRGNHTSRYIPLTKPTKEKL